MALDTQNKEVLREKLLNEKKRLEAGLLRFADATGTVGSYETRIEDMGTDPDENASEVEEYVDNLGLEQNLEAQLKDVNDALAKMEAGTYGVCEETGKEIPLDRLMAYPGARTAL
ncbi:MAG: TraR/DksA C4-type zinc finger protein [Candidatus Moranbacteria bacterium]|nr:TraR/DksA C4-type zinc finger protein [Candidatus Moranbacteria bacterium]